MPATAAPASGASQKSQSCPSAQPPTKSAWLVLRAGFTEVLVTGIEIRWISVKREADRERREAGGRGLVACCRGSPSGT